ncbi:DUF2804 domain-containing protein [Breznakiella homolactica]|uniref:DUF2804 domain-containing protein n=1 Tax=Breznakiella homolactica TaxID=2798577 RepID=A0A7T8BAN3_9SPIR|nr:DUF2804 domain-containing protein [Breznakiella homolactica]QQO10894.1 DUF2804 domain-containing protein [Breznakiella homolactica]
MAQIETTESCYILDEHGVPVKFGWARKPLFTYNHTFVRAPMRRVTASDRYIVFSSDHLILTEILDGGFLGYVGITVMSFKDKKRSSGSITVPFSLGSFNLSDSSESGSVRIQQKHFSIDFIAMDGGSRILKIDIPRFSHNRGLRGAIILTPPPDAESIITAMPWRGQKNAFQYTRRSPWYIAEGVMQLGRSELVFSKDKAWGIFDWNRTVRPDMDVRYWAGGCGLAGDTQVSFSVGYGSADNGSGTENAFFVGGKLIKLDQVTFHINPGKWLDPWRFTSNDRRLEMNFVPEMERTERHRMLFHYLRRRQVFGRFSGKVVLDDGRELSFQNIIGFAERKKTRY